MNEKEKVFHNHSSANPEACGFGCPAPTASVTPQHEHVFAEPVRAPTTSFFPVTVSLNPAEQAVILALGDGDVHLLTDQYTGTLPGITSLQRVACVARLRALADQIEEG